MLALLFLVSLLLNFHFNCITSLDLRVFFLENDYQILLLSGKESPGLAHECSYAVGQGVMLLPILVFEENTITFEAVDSLMAVGALGFPHMLLHTLDQTSSCATRWSGTSEPPTCATLRPKLIRKFSFLI